MKRKHRTFHHCPSSAGGRGPCLNSEFRALFCSSRNKIALPLGGAVARGSSPSTHADLSAALRGAYYQSPLIMRGGPPPHYRVPINNDRLVAGLEGWGGGSNQWRTPIEADWGCIDVWLGIYPKASGHHT